MEIIGSDPLVAYLKLTQNTVRRTKQRSQKQVSLSTVSQHGFDKQHGYMIACEDTDRDVSFVYIRLTGTSINLALPTITHFTQGLRTHHADLSRETAR